MRAARARGGHRRGGPLPLVLRARQGARGPRRVRGVVRLLRARQRSEESRPALPDRADRAQRRICRRPSAHASSSPARRGYGCDSGEPIFIVGLPRAGSTLLEQILASHSQVEGTTELPNILRLVTDLQGRDPRHPRPRYPESSSASPRMISAISARSISRIHASIAPASRDSSTRCRTISDTSGSFI